MRTRISGDAPRRTLVVVCDKGEDPVRAITAAVVEHDLRAAQVTGVGALERVTVGYFDRARKDYDHIEVGEQVELLSLDGDVAVKDDEPVLHAHVVLGRRDGSTVGGHLVSGSVCPTLEAVVAEVGPELAKRVDPETGLALISP